MRIDFTYKRNNIISHSSLRPGGSFNLGIYFIEINRRAGAAAAFGATTFAAETLVYQPGYISRREYKNQENNYLLNHDTLITLPIQKKFI
jgi:hypothetical protein